MQPCPLRPRSPAMAPTSSPSSKNTEQQTAATSAVSASTPLDDFLSGKHEENYPFGFSLSLPSGGDLENENEGSCDESVTSELTMMTYRAELMKQVSNELLILDVHVL